jgi:hypothetical protein
MKRDTTLSIAFVFAAALLSCTAAQGEETQKFTPEQIAAGC